MKYYLFFIVIFLSSVVSNANIINVSFESDIENANLLPGDTLLMDKNADWSNVNIDINATGTAANPIVLLAEGWGELIISGDSSLDIGGEYIIVSGIRFEGITPSGGDQLVRFRYSSSNHCYNCRITNCTFIDNNTSSVDDDTKWIGFYGRNNRLDHCWVEGKTNEGVVIAVWLDNDDPAPNYHRIDNNYFSRPEFTGGNNGAEIIRIGDSSTSLINSYMTVENNVFYECDGEAEIISSKSNYNTFRNNVFYRSQGALTLRHGHFCTVEGNYFFGDNRSSVGGVRIIGYGHTVVNNYFQDIQGSGNIRGPIMVYGGVEGFDENTVTNRYVAATNCLIAHNTIVNSNQNIVLGIDKTSSSEDYTMPQNCDIVNNIIIDGEDDVISFYDTTVDNFNYDANIYYNTDLGSSLSGFTEIDPLLSGGTNYTPYVPASSSPAIDAATNSYGITTDIDGNSRILPDIGSHEYNPTYSSSPLVSNEVGPFFYLCPNGDDNLNGICNEDEITAFSLKVMLEAFMQSNGKMESDLNGTIQLSLLTQPFNIKPWYYNGIETMSVAPADLVDWVLVHFYDVAENVIYTQACYVNEDGEVFDTDGNSLIDVISSSTAQYASVSHKSHLAVVANTTVLNNNLIDFTQNGTTIGISQTKLVEGVPTAYAGDIDGNGLINNLDFNIWEQNNAIINVYVIQDIDGNGIVNNLDYNYWILNRSKVGDLTISY